MISLGLTPKDYSNLCQVFKNFHKYFRGEDSLSSTSRIWIPFLKSYLENQRQFKIFLSHNPQNTSDAKGFQERFLKSWKLWIQNLYKECPAHCSSFRNW